MPDQYQANSMIIRIGTTGPIATIRQIPLTVEIAVLGFRPPVVPHVPLCGVSFFPVVYLLNVVLVCLSVVVSCLDINPCLSTPVVFQEPPRFQSMLLTVIHK